LEIFFPVDLLARYWWS